MLFFNEKFKAIRISRGITLDFVAKYLNKGRKSVWTWEKGSFKPTASEIRMLADLLKVDLNEISDLEELSVRKNYLHDDIDRVQQEFSDLSTEKQGVILDLKNELKRLNRLVNEQNNLIKKLNDVIDVQHSLIFTKNKQLRFTSINKSFVLHLNLGVSDIIGKVSSDIFSSSDYSELLALEKEVFRHGISIISRKIMIPGSSRKKIGLVSIYPSWDSGTVSSITCVINDITAHIHTEERMNLLELAVNNIDDNIWIKKMSPVPQYIFISRSIKDIYGHDASEFYQDPNMWYKVIHPDDKHIVNPKPEFKPYVKSRYRIIRPDNSIAFIEDKVFYDKARSLYYGVIADITEEQLLNEKLRLLEYLTSKVDYMVWIIEYNRDETDFNFIYINDAITKILNEKKEIFFKNPYHLSTIIHPEDKNKVETWWSSEAGKHISRKTSNTYRIIRNDGQIITIEDTHYKVNIWQGRKMVMGILKEV